MKRKKLLSVLCSLTIILSLLVTPNMIAKAENKIVINEININSEIVNGMCKGALDCTVDASGDNLEYAWGIKLYSNSDWMKISDWNKKPSLYYDFKKTLFTHSDSIVSCMVREKNKPETMVYMNFRFGYHPHLKGKCQMPYEGDGGGYLIGCEVYDNDCTVEMLILDCTLLAEGKDAWIYTTGRCEVENNCMWTVWQPQYGYYWTLFRVYNNEGKRIDEYCYGFQNVDGINKVPEEDIQNSYPAEINKVYERIEVEGVEFDMKEFPESVVINESMEGIWPIPVEDIDYNDMEYVISGCDVELLSTIETPNILVDDIKHYDRKEKYYVGGWNNMIAFVESEKWQGDNDYKLLIYSGNTTGKFDVSAYYKGKLIRTCNVSVESENKLFKHWRDWVDTVEAGAWTDEMDEKQKLRAIKNYVYNNYLYSDGYYCNQGAAALYFAARDMGLKARYRFVGPSYDYEAGHGDEYYWGGMASCGGHVCTVITIDGEDYIYETQGRRN